MLAILSSSLLTSCARILNEDTHEISIRHDTSITRMWVNGVELTNSDISPRRNAEPLTLTMESYGRYDTLDLESHSSGNFWGNIITNYGIGMIFDWDHPRRWGYPSTTYLRVKDGELEEWRHEPRPKGMLAFHLGLPHMNSFKVERDSGNLSGGFWGLELGLSYYLDENVNVTLLGGAVTDFFAPVPAAVTIIGPWRSTSGHYLDLRTHRIFDRFDVGAGLSFGEIRWRMVQDTAQFQSQGAKAFLGLSLSGAYRVGEHGQFGVLYHPYFLRSDDGWKQEYSEHVSLFYSWSISLSVY